MLAYNLLLMFLIASPEGARREPIGGRDMIATAVVDEGDAPAARAIPLVKMADGGATDGCGCEGGLCSDPFYGWAVAPGCSTGGRGAAPTGGVLALVVLALLAISICKWARERPAPGRAKWWRGAGLVLGLFSLSVTSPVFAGSAADDPTRRIPPPGHSTPAPVDAVTFAIHKEGWHRLDRRQ